MRKILLILFTLLSTYSFADFIGISPSQLQEKINQKVAVIDIRTPMEWKETGVVPTSKKIMFFTPDGKYDVQAWLDDLSKIIKNQDTSFVLVCRTGSRTGIVGEFLSKQLKFKNVFHLQNGIVAWVKENKKVVK